MRRKAGLALSDFDFSGIQSTGAATGGDGGKIAQAWQSVRSNSPRYDSINASGVAARANEKSAAMTADAQVYGAQVTADAQVEAAELQAEAAKAAARSQAQGSMMGSVFGAIGSIGAGLLSDERSKNSIEPLENALATLRQLKPVTFKYNNEYTVYPERTVYGFVAQEYQKVMPDATFDNHASGLLSIDTTQLIALLVQAVQQLEGRVTRLEAENALVGV